jgi:hypothetical protein
MRIVSALVFILFSTAFTYGATPIPEKTDAQKTVEEFTFKRYLIILGAKTDYFESLKIAKAISKQSGHKYDRQGRIYDKKRGPQFNVEVQHLGPAETGGYPGCYEYILQASVFGRT